MWNQMTAGKTISTLTNISLAQTIKNNKFLKLITLFLRDQ